MLKVRAGAMGGSTERSWTHLRGIPERTMASGQGLQPLAGLGGKGQQAAPLDGRRGDALFRASRRCLQDHMAVGPREAKTTHARERTRGALKPRGWPGWDDHRGVGQRDVRVELLKVQVRGQHLPVEHENGLEQRTDACGALEVSVVGLDGAQSQGLALTASTREHVDERADFDGVSEGGAGAVTLDVADFLRGEAGGGEGVEQEATLSDPVGCGHAVAASVLVHGGASDDRPDVIAVGQGLREPLEHHHTGPFASDISIGGGVEGAAASGGGHHAGFGEVDGGLGGEYGVDTTGEG